MQTLNSVVSVCGCAYECLCVCVRVKHREKGVFHFPLRLFMYTFPMMSYKIFTVCLNCFDEEFSTEGSGSMYTHIHTYDVSQDLNT